MKKVLSIVIALTVFANFLQAKPFSLKSPSKNITIEVEISKAQMTWSVEYKGEQILEPSVIALELADGTILGKANKRIKPIRRSVDEQLTNLVPTKFHKIRDHYNELVLRFGKDYAVVFRAYDNGVAYRFETYYEQDIEIKSETSQWNLYSEALVYWANEKNPYYITHCEANFREKPISSIGADSYSYMPLSMKTPKGTRVVITEADLFDYPNFFLRAGQGKTLNAEFPKVIDDYELRTDRDVNITKLANVIARTDGERTFPWRVMTIGSDAELLENTLPWQLSSEEIPGEYSWLKPGKISWEWWAMLNIYGVDFKQGVNTETYKYYVDFAAKYGLEYILMDEGWSKSTLNIVEPNPELDVRYIIDYAKSKGVGVVLWTLWTPFELQGIAPILDVYESWGVSGIKIDFMQMQDQNMVNFYEDIAKECCKRHLLVDYHGAYKPAGLQRKYPNAMTYEGVYGMEHDKCSYDISPDHDLKLPFTRMVAGPMDYTPGAVRNATRQDFSISWNHPMSQGTRSHQAALFVVFESPLTMLCDTPSNYLRAPEFTEFIAAVPTVWKQTIAHSAVAGEYILMSRETMDGRWYSAGLTNWTARELTLDTSFLGSGTWKVCIHKDGVNADMFAEDYKIENLTIKAGEKIELQMAPGGGWAAEFVKE